MNKNKMMKSNHLVSFSVILSILLIRNVNEVFAHDNAATTDSSRVPLGLKAQVDDSVLVTATTITTTTVEQSQKNGKHDGSGQSLINTNKLILWLVTGV